MKILIVTRHLPWPLDSGGNTAQFVLLDYLRQKHEFTMIVEIFRPESYGLVAELQNRLPEVKIVPVGKRSLTTTPQNRRLSSRILQSCKDFAKSLLDVLNVPAYPFKGLPLEMIQAVQQQVMQESYDLIQVEFTETMSIVEILPKSSKKTFVNHQIHYKYVERQLKTSRGFSNYYKFALNYFLKIIKNQELGFLNQYDAVLVFSDTDKHTLMSDLAALPIPALPIYVSPFPVDLPKTDNQILGEFQNKLVYLGGEKHYPNKDAVDYFFEKIWGNVLQESPEMRVYIVGKWSPQSIAKYSLIQNVTFTGFVPSLLEVFAGSIMIVPLRIGSGIRTKILDAMAYGVPVVSTTIGCEGLPVTNQENILISDDENSFADAISSLMENRELRQKISRNGLQLIEDTYTRDKAGEVRNDIYAKILNMNATSDES